MDIFGTKTRAQLQEMMRERDTVAQERARLVDENSSLKGEVKTLHKAQEFLVKDILSLEETQTANRGNDYADYESAVTALDSKYRNTAAWGTMTKRIIDLRAAFILGDSIKVTHTTETKAEAERELQFAKDFLAYNGLEAEMAQEIVKEAEIEGKCAVKLKYVEEPEKYRERPGMISARFISWTTKKYEVESDPEDYLWYKRLSWKAEGANPEGELTEPQFVFKKFGGRINNPNDATPPVAPALTQIDRLDQALYDLRRGNHLFASATPDFEVQDAQQCEALLSQLQDTNWKIGKAIAHTGKFEIKSPDSTGVANLIAEIELIAKIISGITGIPVHWLGLLDLIKNRATGDNTRELVMLATTREREIWIGAFSEIIEKAMEMYNASTGEGQKSSRLDPEKIKVTIPLISEEYWAHLQNVYLPAVSAGVLSPEAVAEKFPDIDVEAEEERRQEKAQEEADAAKAEMDLMRAKLGQAAAGVEA